MPRIWSQDTIPARLPRAYVVYQARGCLLGEAYQAGNVSTPACDDIFELSSHLEELRQ